MCYKIASNFSPSKERLFFIFHLFATCFIQIPNGFPSITPFLNDKIIEDGDQTFLGGESEEGKKTRGGGRGKTLWQLKGFWSPLAYGDRKKFDHHAPNGW
jgi:hypothetical protein